MSDRIQILRVLGAISAIVLFASNIASCASNPPYTPNISDVDVWVESEVRSIRINTGWNGIQNIPYEYHISPAGVVLIRTPGKQGHIFGGNLGGNNIHREMTFLCDKKFGTRLEKMISIRAKVPMMQAFYYPPLVEGKCLPPDQHQRLIAEQLERNRIQQQAVRERKAQIEERERAVLAQETQKRKSSCTEYGFTAGTDAHATCVMELAIAAEANEQQRIADAARAAAIASQAAVSNAASEAAADEARRQRQAQALIGLGAAISSGGASPSSSASSPIAPLSSGRYKTCRYRVSGEIVSSTVGRAELCSATRSIGGQTGYLVR